MLDCLKEIETLFTALAVLTEAGIVWKNPDGSRGIDGLPDKYFLHCNSFCEKVKSSKSCLKECASNVYSLIEATQKEILSPFIHQCHAGAAELIVPVYEDGSLSGILFIGPFRELSATCTYPRRREEFRLLKILDEEKLKAVGVIVSELSEKISELKKRHNLDLIKRQISHPKILYAIDIINKNISSQISTESLADEIGLSVSRFIHLFKEQTGENFSSYLRSARIELAKRLLRDTNMKVFEIADACGYTGQCYFGLVFRKVSGVSPGEYRKLYGSTMRI